MESSKGFRRGRRLDHPSEETLKRLASGTASREEGKAVVAHLLKGCADCARKLRSFIEPEPVAGRLYESRLARFDRELLEAMETSVHPKKNLRNLPDEDPRFPDPGLPKGDRGN
jgi:hypothetical protein